MIFINISIFIARIKSLAVKYTGGKLVTATERLLVYLIDYRTYEGEMEGPIELTQARVAEAVGITIGNVGRTVKPLEKDGLMLSHKVHVPGIRQKRAIYYLTQEGKKKAKTVKDRIRMMDVGYVDRSGESHKMAIGQMLDDLPPEIRLIDVLRETDDATFDHNQYLEKMYQVDRMFFDPASKFTEPRYFFGRSQELKDIEKWCDSPSSKTLIIKGLPGIGKTTLIARMLLDAPSDVDVFCYCIQSWTSPRALLRQLFGCLADCKAPELKKYTESNMEIDLAEVEYLLTEALSEKKYTMVFDDYHNASTETKDLFSMLHTVIVNIEDTKLVVIGRKVEPFYDKREVAVKKQVNELTLAGLEEDDSLSLAKKVKVPDDILDSVHEQTAGHPLFIELLSQGRASPKQDIGEFIVDEFTKVLSEEEQDLLKFISVFRFPVHKRVFRTNQPVLIQLVKHSILGLSNDDFVIMHDMLRDSFYDMLSGVELEEFHSLAAEHYLESSASSNLVEALHHLLGSGQFSGAVDIIIDKGQDLLKSGKVEDLSKILTSLLSKDIELEDSTKAELTVLQGTALSFLGEWDQEIDQFEKISSSKDTELVTMKATLETGKILLKRNEYTKAKPLFDKVLDWAVKQKEMATIAENHYMLGSLNERQAHLDSAREHFEKSKKISIEINDRLQQAQAEYGLGRINHKNHRFEQALESKKRALDLAMRIGEENTAAKILTSIGGTLEALDQLDKAIEANQSAIEFAKRNGAIRTLGYALSNAGAAFIDKPDLAKSWEYLDSAHDLFKKLEEERMIATVKVNMAVNLALRSKFEFAYDMFSDCITILDDRKDKRELMICNFKFGQTLNKIGHSKEAQTHLIKALGYSKDLRDKASSELIQKEMSI